MQDLHFGTPSNETYSLIELPSEILSLLSNETPLELEIKGQPNDETMLCTPNAVYAVRAVQSSNTLLLCSTRDEGGLQVKANLSQTLDCTLCLPRLDRIDDLLAEHTWIHDEPDPIKVSKRLSRYTLEDLYSLVQAHASQIDAYLHTKRVLRIQGYLRPVAPASQLYLLSSLLRIHQDASPNTLLQEFAEDAEIDVELARQVISWFPAGSGLDVESVVREVGKLLMQTWWTGTRKQAQKPGSMISLKEFMDEWAKVVGDKAEKYCDMALLQGNFILNGSDGLLSVPIKTLPLDPSARFARLFSLKPRWKPDEMKPFLLDIAVNDKEREKWILKSVRKVKDGKETVFVSR